MQRSRKAFLPRKAFNNNASATRNTRNKFSVPLLLCFWWVSFLFIANGRGGESVTLNEKTCRQEVEQGLIKGFFPGAECPSAHVCCQSAYWGPHSTQADTSGSGIEKQSEEEYEHYGTTVKEQVEAEIAGGSVKGMPKSDGFIRDVPVGLDQFKNKVINPKGKPAIHQLGSTMCRVEPGRKEYNFASFSKELRFWLSIRKQREHLTSWGKTWISTFAIHGQRKENSRL